MCEYVGVVGAKVGVGVGDAGGGIADECDVNVEAEAYDDVNEYELDACAKGGREDVDVREPDAVADVDVVVDGRADDACALGGCMSVGDAMGDRIYARKSK